MPARRGPDRLHSRHRDWRGRQQQLLLRSVRLARRRLHVQRRVGRLLRPPRGRARGLAGPPRGHRRRTRRPREQRAGAAHRAAGTNRSSAPNGRRTVPTPRRSAEQRRHRLPRQASTEREAAGTAAAESRGYSDDRSQQATAERSGTSRTRSPATRAGSRNARRARADKAAAAARARSGGGGRRR